ncbi:MAG: patatin-like phospholipase family protein [Prosthecobacter sp.]|nr:patatin-like phospholipase family protein [Prosthecobacter sp.]
MSRPPRIAISLGASFLGYATHAGFLARLHELGVRPASVGGSSAGAVAAGLYAAGLDTKDIREAVLSWSLRWSFMRKTPWWTHYARVTFNSPHISAMHPRGAVDHFDALVGGKNIEDMQTPSFMAAVTDLAANRTLFLRQGSLAKAMAASCCMPTVMTPLEHAGIQCFDGGVAHETPVDPWLEDPEIDLIVAHRVSHTPSAALRFFPFNLINLTGQMHACAGEQLLEYRRRLATFHNKTMLVIHTVHDRPSIFSGKGMAGFYAAGEAQAQRLYDEQLKSLLG